MAVGRLKATGGSPAKHPRAQRRSAGQTQQPVALEP